MGNRPSKVQAHAYNPVMTGWELKERTDDYNLWRNPSTGEELEEYRRVFPDKKTYDYEKQVFEFRHGSNTLVASKFFQEQSQKDLCSTFYKGNIFIEHIPLRLNKVNDIPYPDVLHIYHQSFRGFAELYEKVGFFEPTESLICINQQARVKIWLNEDLSKSVPNRLIVQHDQSQAHMVRTVVNLIHANTDDSSLPASILDTMRQNDVKTFREADTVLQEFAAKYGAAIPSQLDCVLEINNNAAALPRVEDALQPSEVQQTVGVSPFPSVNLQGSVTPDAYRTATFPGLASIPMAMSVRASVPTNIAGLPYQRGSVSGLQVGRQTTNQYVKPTTSILPQHRSAINYTFPTNRQVITKPAVVGSNQNIKTIRSVTQIPSSPTLKSNPAFQIPVKKMVQPRSIADARPAISLKPKSNTVARPQTIVKAAPPVQTPKTVIPVKKEAISLNSKLQNKTNFTSYKPQSNSPKIIEPKTYIQNTTTDNIKFSENYISKPKNASTRGVNTSITQVDTKNKEKISAYKPQPVHVPQRVISPGTVGQKLEERITYRVEQKQDNPTEFASKAESNCFMSTTEPLITRVDSSSVPAPSIDIVKNSLQTDVSQKQNNSNASTLQNGFGLTQYRKVEYKSLKGDSPPKVSFTYSSNSGSGLADGLLLKTETPTYGDYKYTSNYTSSDAYKLSDTYVVPAETYTSYATYEPVNAFVPSSYESVQVTTNLVDVSSPARGLDAYDMKVSTYEDRTGGYSYQPAQVTEEYTKTTYTYEYGNTTPDTYNVPATNTYNIGGSGVSAGLRFSGAVGSSRTAEVGADSVGGFIGLTIGGTTGGSRIGEVKGSATVGTTFGTTVGTTSYTVESTSYQTGGTSYSTSAYNTSDSYKVSFDNDLLKDLELMKAGMLSPNKDVPNTFVTNMSFGATSHYIRDSIKSVESR